MPSKKSVKGGALQRQKMPDKPIRRQDTAQNTDIWNVQIHKLPIELQQAILNVFCSAFPIVEDIDELKRTIQQVKGHLFNRDFSAAFGKPEYLQSYALRWSAARALAYANILTHPDRRHLLSNTGIKTPNTKADFKSSNLEGRQDDDNTPNDLEIPSTPTKVVSIGGGAGAELVALAAAYRDLTFTTGMNFIALDIANWKDSVEKLKQNLLNGPVLSTHASEAARLQVENQPLLDGSSLTDIRFIHDDILTCEPVVIQEALKGATLCTVFFTLNELFSCSLPRTTSLLLKLTEVMSPGSHLLVVDSPGSYSEITLGKDKSGEQDEKISTPAKKYPMKWLMDHTLLEVANNNKQAAWEKIESHDSLWFRIDQEDREKLRYPIELENMRYQLHLYRKR